MKKKIWHFVPAACFAVLGLCIVGLRGYRFPGLLCFGIAAVILIDWFLAQRPGTVTRWLRRCLTALLILAILSAAVTGFFVGRACEGNPNAECDYVIVLGASLNGKKPSLILKERLDVAVEYLTTHEETVCVVSGGQGPGEDMTEASFMKEYLTGRGIDADRIWLEEKSTSTWENLEFSLGVIEEKTGKRPHAVGIVSSEFHLYRAGLVAEKMQVTAIGIPVKTSRVSLFVSYFLREIAAVWKYAVLGG